MVGRGGEGWREGREGREGGRDQWKDIYHSSLRRHKKIIPQLAPKYTPAK